MRLFYAFILKNAKIVNYMEGNFGWGLYR